MTAIHDFSNLSLSDRNGMYSGNSGDKEGVRIEGERWIIKAARLDTPSLGYGEENRAFPPFCLGFTVNHGIM